MTDEEVICTWMEKRPPADLPRHHYRDFRWWVRRVNSPDFEAVSLGLNDLWEVEERLKQERDRAAALPFDSMPKEALACVRRWTEYRNKLWSLSDASDTFCHADAFHATSQQRIQALAAVLRPIVEEGAA